MILLTKAKKNFAQSFIHSIHSFHSFIVLKSKNVFVSFSKKNRYTGVTQLFKAIASSASFCHTLKSLNISNCLKEKSKNATARFDAIKAITQFLSNPNSTLLNFEICGSAGFYLQKGFLFLFLFIYFFLFGNDFFLYNQKKICIHFWGALMNSEV